MLNNSKDVKALLSFIINENTAELSYSEVKEYLIDLDDELESSTDFNFTFEGVEYRFISESTIDEVWTDSLIDTIKDCYSLSEIPDFIVIDWESTAESCKVDGLGHHFNSNDGSEEFLNGWNFFNLG